MTLKKERSE